jgi:hypothetical protein
MCFSIPPFPISEMLYLWTSLQKHHFDGQPQLAHESWSTLHMRITNMKSRCCLIWTQRACLKWITQLKQVSKASRTTQPQSCCDSLSLPCSYKCCSFLQTFYSLGLSPFLQIAERWVVSWKKHSMSESVVALLPHPEVWWHLLSLTKMTERQV